MSAGLLRPPGQLTDQVTVNMIFLITAEIRREIFARNTNRINRLCAMLAGMENK